MQKLKILVAGSLGQLGSEFVEVLNKGCCELGNLDSELIGCEVYGFSSKELNIADLKQVEEVLNKVRPDCVVNCAAFTDVDGCETKTVEAFKVNGLGPRNLAIICEKIGAKLVHISTDYVFDGEAYEPYFEFSQINPQSVYGKTKAAGEFYVQRLCRQWFIIRTSWLYGKKGKNFVKTIAKLAETKGKIKVVADQFGSPTNVVDLVFAVCKLIVTNEFGVFHGSGNGVCSWHEFAKEIVKLFKIDAVVEPCLTSQFKRPAKRPRFSVMENSMFELTVGYRFRHWFDALKSFCDQVELSSFI